MKIYLVGGKGIGIGSTQPAADKTIATFEFCYRYFSRKQCRQKRGNRLSIFSEKTFLGGIVFACVPLCRVSF